MDPSALSAFGLLLDMAAALLILVFAAGMPHVRAAHSPAEAAERTQLHRAIGLIGFLALFSGLFLQIVANVETARLEGLT